MKKLAVLVFVIILLISYPVYAASFFQPVIDFFTSFYNSISSFFNAVGSVFFPKTTSSGGGGGGGGGTPSSGGGSTTSCSASLSISSTGKDTCTITATITSSYCDNKSYSIKDSAEKCSGTISGNSSSIGCSWSVTTSTYAYNLYVGGAYKASKSVTCSATPLPTCSDGTLYNQCSSTKPKYCSSGTLINKCSQCNCPSGQSCNTTTESCYTPQNCGNGNINTGEQCELPSTSNNNYCSQSTSSCNSTSRKYCTRDSYGNCNSNCQCVLDSWVCGSAGDSNYCNNCNHCGDGSVNCGETQSNCCADAGCPTGQTCQSDGSCKSLATTGTIWAAHLYVPTASSATTYLSNTVFQAAKDMGITHIHIWQYNFDTGSRTITRSQLVDAVHRMKSYGLQPIIDLEYNVSEAVALVTELGSDCMMYEVGKEPHVSGTAGYATVDEYVNYFNQIVTACRQVNPNAMYGGPTVGSPTTSPEERSGFYVNAYLQQCDGDFLSVHSYPGGSTQPQAISNVRSKTISDVQQLKSKMTLYGKNLPIVISEISWTSAEVCKGYVCTDPACWDCNQTFNDQWTTALMSTAEEQNISAIVFWDLIGYDNNFAILRPPAQGYEKKPQYYSIQNYITGAVNKCTDGTAYNQCSSTKPKYCSSGTLINKCSQCGCPTGQTCNTTSEACYTPTGTVSVTTGINYMSSGNRWTDSDSQLDADFSRFSNDGIKHISVRMMWSLMEPDHSDTSTVLDATSLSNVKRVLTEANKYGVKVNLDFWTQHGYTLGLPGWVGSYWDIESIPEIRNHYVRYMQAVVNELKSYPALESWTVLNEPWFGTASNGANSGKNEFQTTFPILYNAIKSVDPSHTVTCRFTLSYTPGSGSFDSSVYDVFDVFAITEYLDPSNPSDTRYNGRWSYWDKTISDLKARNRPLWVIEFGDDNSNEEHVRLHYEQSLQKFNAAGIVQRAYAWAWQTRSASGELFNIYDGTNPKPAYYELTS